MSKDENYYTVAEIIMILRYHYQHLEELLKQMRDLVVIDTSYPNDSKLSYHFSRDDGNEKEPFMIRLKVSKKNDVSFGTYVRQILNQRTFDDYRWRKDNASFDVEDTDGFYILVSYGNGEEKEFFKPRVYIPSMNQEEFKRLYNEVKQSPLYQLPSTMIYCNPFQTLFIDESGVQLDCRDDNDKGITVHYRPETDNIKVDSKIHYSACFLNDLLETKVPKYELPQELLSFLEGELDQESFSYIEGFTGRRHDEYTIQNKGKRLVLVPKKPSNEI